MKQEKSTKEKICVFYASDYHFEMISLPYINKRMEDKDKIIILTENNLEKTMKSLLDKTNLKEEKKQKILNLDWKNKNLEELKNIKNIEKDAKNVVIFIKGKEKYINRINQNLEEFLPENKDIKIVNCYNIEEVGENMEDILAKHQKILRTAGEKEINKF